VQAGGATFTSTGSDCDTACKYLEAPTSSQSAGIAWATTAAFCYATNSTTGNQNCQSNSIYSGTTAEQAASRTAATAIGTGMANTNQIYARLTTASGLTNTANYAAGIAWAYSNNGKTDWHLPSKAELAKFADGGAELDTSHWSSSEFSTTSPWGQSFGFCGGPCDPFSDSAKNGGISVRVVRAFG
jgi:hypothetical protein